MNIIPNDKEFGVCEIRSSNLTNTTTTLFRVFAGTNFEESDEYIWNLIMVNNSIDHTLSLSEIVI